MSVPQSPRRHRSSSGGLSRRLLRDTGSMVEAGRLLGYAVLELVTLLRWTLMTLGSILGVTRLDATFQAMERNGQRQRRWASQRSGRASSATCTTAPRPGW